jgi:hypothetical protein
VIPQDRPGEERAILTRGQSAQPKRATSVLELIASGLAARPANAPKRRRGAKKSVTAIHDMPQVSDAPAWNRTLFPHAFGLRTSPAALDGTAFDRCLLLALVLTRSGIFYHLGRFPGQVV